DFKPEAVVPFFASILASGVPLDQAVPLGQAVLQKMEGRNMDVCARAFRDLTQHPELRDAYLELLGRVKDADKSMEVSGKLSPDLRKLFFETLDRVQGPEAFALCREALINGRLEQDAVWLPRAGNLARYRMMAEAPGREQDFLELASRVSEKALPGTWKEMAADPPEVHARFRKVLGDQRALEEAWTKQAGKTWKEPPPLGDVKAYLSVARALRSDQVERFGGCVGSLVQAGFSPAEGYALAARAAEKGRLDEDAPRLTRLGKPTEATANYAMLTDKVRPGDEEAFLTVLATVPQKQLGPAWEAVSGVDGETPQRLETWLAVRGELPPDKGHLADRLVSAVPRGGDLEWARTSLVNVLRTGVRPDSALEACEKIQKSGDPKLVGALVAGGTSLEEALKVTQTTGRKNFPGKSVDAEERARALSLLTRVNSGSLPRALDDFAFLASQLDDESELPQAAEFLARLRDLRLNDREARLAFGDLRRRNLDEGFGPTFMAALELTGTYAGARPIWEACAQLAPSEAARRMQALQPCSGQLRDSLPVDQLTRLAVAQLANPLPEPSLGTLAGMLCDRSPVGWEGKCLNHDGPQGRARTLTRGDEVRTGPLSLPSDGEYTVLCETWHKISTNDAGLVLAGGAREATVGGRNNGWQWTSLGTSLKDAARLTLKPNSYVRSDELRVRQMVLVPRPLNSQTSGSLSVAKGKKEAAWTGDAVAVPAGGCHLEFFTASSLQGARASLEVSTDKKDWKPLRSFGTAEPSREHCRIDLSEYRGKSVHLRFTLQDPAEEPKSSFAWSALLFRAPSDTFSVRLGGRDALSSDTFQSVLEVAFGPAPERLGALSLLSAGGDELPLAVRLLDESAGAPEADLRDRAAALKVLRKGRSEGEVAEVFRTLTQARVADERAEDLARLLAGRDLNNLLRFCQKVALECGSEASPGTALRFLADFQERTDAVRTDRVWQLVSRPIRDEALQDRVEGFHALLEAVKGDVDAASALWDQVCARPDPSDNIGGSARAAAELMAVLNDVKKVQAMLTGLQKLQDGPLEGRSLQAMAHVLITRSLMGSGNVDEALRRLPVEMPNSIGVEERDQHVVVGGVTVKKRETE
ncbi:MAG: hypothetical protein AB1758_03815, partial [Candidatus Eremiobacterota bacterium]